jgi:hypothetical protein
MRVENPEFSDTMPACKSKYLLIWSTITWIQVVLPSRLSACLDAIRDGSRFRIVPLHLPVSRQEDQRSVFGSGRESPFAPLSLPPRCRVSHS